MEIAQHLLEKYNTPVPRYTSYPPANHFRDFTALEYISLLKDSNNGEPKNIAFYIHIPFCRKICYYCGCNSCAMGKADEVTAYMDALRKEIRLVSQYIDRSRPVSQIHYGGGTPNAIDIRFLSGLNEMLFSEFRFIDKPEIAIECNPAYLSLSQLDILIDSGFNRFSLGIQDFNLNVLKSVNRTPSAIFPGELLAYIKNRNDSIGVNFDFIYGLPEQTVNSFTETIGKAVSIRPDRLVTFSYAHVPWLKKHQLILEKRGLPSSTEKMDMFLEGYRICREAGYESLGLDHFVLPSDDLFRAYGDNQLHRNFQGYCTRRTTGQVYAFGVSGISQLENGYCQNVKDINNYLENVDHGVLPVEKGYLLNETQKITREVINRLMCNKKIRFSELASELGIKDILLKESVGFSEERLEDLISDDLVEFSGDELSVTEKGSFFIRNIAVIFDKNYRESNKTYSRNV